MPRRADRRCWHTEYPVTAGSARMNAAQQSKGSINMKKTTRRSLLATAAAVTAASIADAAPAAAQAAPKPIFPVPMVTIPIVGETECVPGPPHLLHRPQLRRARDRARLGSEPRAAVLLPEADRCDPERRGRRGRRPSLSVADQELSSRGRAGGRAEIRRHQHPGREGARPCLWLRARPRHDPARSPERHGGGEEAVGDRQEL